jgi:uncharacterized protein (TIGR00369 family)
MNIKTHSLAKSRLLGKPILIKDDDEALVELETTEEMVVDELGLIHGGFSFGLADYASMLAVNHPFVVLGASEVRFLAPVKIGEVMMARAKVVLREGKRREVETEIVVDGKKVFEGRMTCFVLDRHILSRGR